ncbi:NaCP60E, partial [Symbiodinium microadriaticum]
FEFLKAFMMDRDMASIEVEPYYEELSESTTKEKFTELPLCIIREKYERAPGGKKFIEDILKSQVGRKHPQSDDENMMIYKVFDSVASSSTSAIKIRYCLCLCMFVSLYRILIGRCHYQQGGEQDLCEGTSRQQSG